MPVPPSMFRHFRPAGQPAGAEGCLEVVAADRPVQVQHFAGQVQSRGAFALHGVGIDFVQIHSDGRDLCLAEPQHARDGNGGGLECLDAPRHVASRDFGHASFGPFSASGVRLTTDVRDLPSIARNYRIIRDADVCRGTRE